MPEDGKRSTGRPQKTWRVTFAENLQDMEVTWRRAKRLLETEEFRRPMLFIYAPYLFIYLFNIREHRQ